MSNITPIEYNSIPVITTKQIAEEHGLEVRVINQKFRRNKSRFELNIDYYVVTKDMITNCDHLLNLFYHDSDELFLFTQYGYLKFVKTINDDKAWAIYNKLIESYFGIKRLNSAEKIFLEKNKENRTCLTYEWSAHGAKNYGGLTVAEYESLFKDKTKRKKDLDDKELSLLSAFEFLEQRKLENNTDIIGDKNLKKSLENTGEYMNKIITNKDAKQLE